MPDDIPGGDFEGCVRVMTEDEGHSEQSAEDICGALQAESKSDHGDASALMDALERGAGLIADVGVDLVSGVDVPAVDSKWVMTKSGGARKGHDYRANTPILLAKSADAEKRITYAAAMIPREPDKEGDVVATPTVEKAAHGFLKGDGGVDTDHSLIDGEGQPVESWVLKQERTFDLPGGGTESYSEGTWMLGIEWGPDAWDRIQAGELTGLSIYGMAEHVPLQRSVSECENCGGRVRAGTSKRPDTPMGDGSESDAMGQDTTADADASADGGDTTEDGGPTLKDLQEQMPTADGIAEAVKEAVGVEKDEQEAAAELAESYGMEPGDVLDVLTVAQGKDPGDVIDAVDSVDADGGGETEADAKEDEGDDDETEKETETAEKRADDANLSKGGGSRETAAKGIDGDGDATTADSLSYQALAEQHGGDN